MTKSTSVWYQGRCAQLYTRCAWLETVQAMTIATVSPLLTSLWWLKTLSSQQSTWGNAFHEINCHETTLFDHQSLLALLSIACYALFKIVNIVHKCE
eukprot:m.228590 g.228590  ORF g.228590 m.228590 type:complete len:97 (-) comp15191_c0_seq3:115-405(-)